MAEQPSYPFGLNQRQVDYILNESWPALAVNGLLDAVRLPGDVASGQTTIDDPATMDRAANFAGNFTGAGLLAPRPANSIGMAGRMLPLPAAAERTAVNEVKEAAGGIRAYHGSPHDFDRFSLDAIGTGEGAQAYGHGLYFADSEDVARSYRESLKHKAIDPEFMREIRAEMGLGETPEGQEAAGLLYNLASNPRNENISPATIVRGRVPAARNVDGEAINKAFEKVSDKARGRMYEVNIKADPETFLDWDKPFTEQAPEVQQAIIGKLTGGDPEMAGLFSGGVQPDDNMLLGMMPSAQGASAYNTVAEAVGGNKAAAEALKARGIPGIKYRDANTRVTSPAFDVPYLERQATKNRAEYAKASDAEKASLDEDLQTIQQRLADAKAEKHISRNYVVFDDSLIEIIRKYGIAGLLGTGALAASQSNEAQAGGLLPAN